MQPKTVPVPIGRPSFINAPRCDSLDALQADVAIIAYPFTVPYTLEWSRQPSSWAPNAIRGLAPLPELSHPTTWTSAPRLFAGRKVQIADCGDVFEVAGEYSQHPDGHRVLRNPGSGRDPHRARR
jgi:hypothetical protein